MSWLRLDDGFTQHPKLAGWTPGQKWSWVEMLSYCARYQTGGRIPEDVKLLPRGITTALLAKAEEAGLIDRADDGGMVIHDWPIYNAGTIREKVAYYLAQHPDASANEVHKAIGGTREIVLAEVARQRLGGSDTGSESGTGPGTAELGRGGSESGSHAREPVPSPKNSPPTPPRGNGTASLKVKDLRRYTGCKITRGTHSSGYKHDPLGTDRPPPDWPYPKPTKAEVEEALARGAHG